MVDIRLYLDVVMYIFVSSSPNFSPFYSATSRPALTTYLVVPSKHFSDERSHLLELDRAGGLGGNIVDNAADAMSNQDLAGGQNRLERDVAGKRTREPR